MSGPEKQTHAPGPWVYKNGYHVWAGRDADECIADVWGISGCHEEVHANARLIAAAPDLLAACEASLALGRKIYHNANAHEAPMDWAHVRQLLETAIAKAEGRA